MNPRKNQMYSVGLLGSPCQRTVPPGLDGSSSFFNKVTVKKSAFVDWALRHLAFDLSLLTSHFSLPATAKSRRALSVMLFFLSITATLCNAGTGDILRGGFSASTAPAATTSGSGNTAMVARLRANEQDILSRTTQALQAVQAMQSAARNVAQNGPNNLGLDPNHPGQQLPNVPNGLTTGGLQVAQGATTNSALWQNANLPTQSPPTAKLRSTSRRPRPRQS